MNVFAPLITHSSPSRTAFVVIPWRSEPAPGSVIAIAPIIAPEARPVRYFSFWACVPKAMR